MKTIAKIAMIGACVAMGVARTSAQTNSGTVVTTVTFQLQADVQTSGTAVGRASVGNKQIITAIAGSNSPNTTIVVKGGLGSGSGPSFFMRQTTGHGKNAVVTDTDISGSLSVSESSSAVQTSGSGGQTKGSEIVTLTLSTDTLDFVLQGYAALQSKSDGTVRVSVKCLTGTGLVNGNTAVFHDGGASSTTSKVESGS